MRALPTRGKPSRHNGLPATITVNTTLQGIRTTIAKGLTGAGSLLPMSDSSAKATPSGSVTPNDSHRLAAGTAGAGHVCGNRQYLDARAFSLLRDRC
ncbi:MAG TPA: DUF222 domain-containing protein [Mycobacterium sp.]|nr:DUF222 domain-containing protein [Mycobacterium sp.]